MQHETSTAQRAQEFWIWVVEKQQLSLPQQFKH